MRIFCLGGDHASELRSLGAEPIACAPETWVGDLCQVANGCDAVLVDDTDGTLSRAVLQCLLECTEKPRIVAVQPGAPWGKYTGASLLVSGEHRAGWHIYAESLLVQDGGCTTRYGRYATTTEPRQTSLATIAAGAA